MKLNLKLLKFKKKIENIKWDLKQIFGLSGDKIYNLKEKIDTEIQYCKYYFELLKIRQNKNFNKWVFYTQENRPKEYSWKTDKGDCWICFNGRIKAVINIKENSKSTKVSLEIINNTDVLKFVDEYRHKQIGYKNLRSKESIKKEIENLKEKAKELFNRYNFPCYTSEKRNFEILNNLLGVA